MVLVWVGAVLGPLAIVLIIRRLLRSRRIFAVWVLSILAVAAWCLGVWGFLVEPTTLTVRHVTIESAEWRGPPLRIGVISDTHVGAPHTDVARIRKLVARMNAEHPDVVVLLGDYTGGHAAASDRTAAARAEILAGVEAFKDLTPPLGVHGVLGNHDSWFDEDQIAAAMRRGGATPLRNQAIRVARAGGDFWIAGVGDMDSPTGPASVARTLARVSGDAPILVLTHWPDPFAQVPSRVALTLAGHTHCGQVNLPLIGRPVLPSDASYRWPCGAYDVSGRKLYVTGGVGVSVLPVRFRAPPEIVIITLKASTGA